MISRRTLLQMAVVSPLAATLLDQFGRHSFINAPTNIAPPLKLTRRWRGSVCESQLTNLGTRPARIKEVVLFDLQLSLPPSTRLYGERSEEHTSELQSP